MGVLGSFSTWDTEELKYKTGSGEVKKLFMDFDSVFFRTSIFSLKSNQSSKRIQFTGMRWYHKLSRTVNTTELITLKIFLTCNHDWVGARRCRKLFLRGMYTNTTHLHLRTEFPGSLLIKLSVEYNFKYKKHFSLTTDNLTYQMNIKLKNCTHIESPQYKSWAKFVFNIHELNIKYTYLFVHKVSSWYGSVLNCRKVCLPELLKNKILNILHVSFYCLMWMCRLYTQYLISSLSSILHFWICDCDFECLIIKLLKLWWNFLTNAFKIPSASIYNYLSLPILIPIFLSLTRMKSGCYNLAGKNMWHTWFRRLAIAMQSLDYILT